MFGLRETVVVDAQALLTSAPRHLDE